MENEMSQDIDLVRGWLDGLKRIAALAGTGISTKSNIPTPDFRPNPPNIFRIFLIAALLSTSSWSWAQSATTGALHGTVVEAAGAVVPGVTVTLLNPTTGQSQTTMTDANGLYGFTLLSPGTYD